MGAKNELIIPPAALADKKSVEILRVWIANKDQHCSIMTVWPEPAAWGIVLADLARHVVNAYGESSKEEKAQTLKRIVDGFRAEVESPTDEPKGSVLS